MARAGWPGKISWGTYDLANTMFSMNVISLYFPLWVASSFHRGEVWYAIAYSFSMLLVAVVSPLAGTEGDRNGHKRVLFLATTVAVILTALLGFGHSIVSVLVIFVAANFGYQVGLVSYNSLLTSVAEPRERGMVSGVGVALGYVGSFVGMFAAFPFVNHGAFEKLPAFLQHAVSALAIGGAPAGAVPARANAFLPTAILFALFSLPLFFFVRERREGRRPSTTGSLREVTATFREIIRRRNLRNFYLATFLYMDAVHTVYIVMATYAKFAIGLDDGQILESMSIALAAAVIGSFLYGILADRVTGRTALMTVLANWVVVMVVAVFAHGFGGFVTVAVIAGCGLGGVEAVRRVALLSLIDEEESGRYFGFFNFTGKASSIIGPQLWALVLFLFEGWGGIRFRIAVGVMLLLVIAAIGVLRRVEFPPVSRVAA
ncbi:MAG: MFS transporter [Thermoanaerobaculia bacterium]